MSENENSAECTAICWGVAALVSVVAMVMLYMLADFSALQAIFIGCLVGALLGVALGVFVCRGSKTPGLHDDAEKPAQRYAREAAEDQERRGVAAPSAAPADAAPAAPAAAAAAPAAASSAPAAAAASSAGSAVLPSKALPGQAELAARKGEWKYEANNAKEAAAAVDQKAAIPAGETAAPAVSADVADETAPKLYDSAPAEGADDLKQIKGVGPKLEQTLNEMGIYRFDQVSAWGPGEIAWVDNRLRFKGRIQRDDWMSQARTLAAGE